MRKILRIGLEFLVTSALFSTLIEILLLIIPLLKSSGILFFLSWILFIFLLMINLTLLLIMGACIQVELEL